MINVALRVLTTVLILFFVLAVVGTGYVIYRDAAYRNDWANWCTSNGGTILRGQGTALCLGPNGQTWGIR